MRTTNKEFKSQVQGHVLGCLDDEHGSTTVEQLQSVVDSFNNWYGAHEHRRIPNKQEAFKDFMMGLPSTFNIEFENYKISETLKSWYVNCGTDYREKTSEEASIQYYHLVTRELGTLCKKLGIKFL